VNAIGSLILASLDATEPRPLLFVLLPWFAALAWLLALEAVAFAAWMAGVVILATVPSYGVFGCLFQAAALAYADRGFSTWIIVYPLGAITVGFVCALAAWIGQASGLAAVLPGNVVQALFDGRMMVAGAFLAYFFFQGAFLQYPRFFRVNRSIRRPFPEFGSPLLTAAEAAQADEEADTARE
jgi:hypothetical protein